MKATPTAIPEVMLIEPRIFGDERGFFFESFNQKVFQETTGLNLHFVQDNRSRSQRSVLRGLHYQLGRPQGKLVQVLHGSIFDVVVDLRKSSKTFGQWLGVELDGDSRRQLWVPPGFAHGFLVTSDQADVFYKTTDYYSPADERCVVWNDSHLNIEWPLKAAPILSAKDILGTAFQNAELFD
jgi:dTDP-4-dehydrorhamnose 3,5-epimerase